MARRKEPAIPNELLDQLLAGGDASAAFDQGGLLDSPKKALTERALNAEIDHHLAGEDGAGKTRNGYGWKIIMTDTGKMAIDVPRDRQSSFDPQLIAKYQRRFPGFDEKIGLMYARGMSTREITGHLHDLYGIDVSPDLIGICDRLHLQRLAITTRATKGESTRDAAMQLPVASVTTSSVARKLLPKPSSAVRVMSTRPA